MTPDRTRDTTWMSYYLIERAILIKSINSCVLSLLILNEKEESAWNSLSINKAINPIIPSLNIFKSF